MDIVNTDEQGSTMSLAGYDVAVVAAPIHAGGYPASVARFVRTHAAGLNSMTSVFCSIGLAVASRTIDGRAQTQPIVDGLLQKTGWHPTHVELVAGALMYSKYNFLTRFIMRRIARREGGDTDVSRDYVYTDWPALDRLAMQLSSDAKRSNAVAS